MSSGCDPVYPKLFADAVGYYRTFYTVMAMDDALLSGLLPSKLELAPQAVTPAGTHPLVFLMGKHFDVRPDFIPFAGMTYLEYICAIPFVQWRDSSNAYRGPFAYMPRMYLNELFPTLLGYLYAYPKLMARIAGNPPTDSLYAVRSLIQDEPILKGTFERRGPELPPDAFPHFAHVRQIFDMPFIGKHELGPYICSKLTFKLQEATLQACDAQIEIQREFVPGLNPQSFTIPGIDSSPLGAFYMAVPWTMTLPFGCDCIDCAP